MKILGRKILTQLTWPGLLGLLLLGLGLIINVLQVQPLADSLGKSQRHDSEAKRKITSEHGAILQQSRLAQFYALLRPSSSITDELAKIYTIADGYGVELRQARYKLFSADDGKLIRYQMTMQVEGDYSRVRNFALRVLKEIPSIALDSIRFERQSTTAGTVTAEMILTLYVVES